MADAQHDERQVPVWDLPTRAFHWTLATLVVGAYITQSTGQIDRHMTIGYCILTLVLFRLVWGVIGSEPSRFRSFLPTPGGVWRYSASLLRGAPHKIAGHNPLGAIVIFTMLGLLAFQAATGLFANDDIFSEGPLAKLVSDATSDRLSDWHRASFWILLAVIGVHVTANLAYEALLRQPLVQAMLSGSKPLPRTIRAPLLRPAWWALAALAFAAGVVWYVVTQL